MQTTIKKLSPGTSKKVMAKKPKKGSIEAVEKAVVIAHKNNLDLSFLRK